MERLGQDDGAQRQPREAHTPARRSAAELFEQLGDIFSSHGTSSPDVDGRSGRTAPVRMLPQLITSFEQRKSIELLTPEEKQQLAAFAQSQPDLQVGVEQLFALISSLSSSQRQQELEQGVANTDDGASPVEGMLNPSSPVPGDGSPAPSRTRPRRESSMSIESVESVDSQASSSPRTGKSLLASSKRRLSQLSTRLSSPATSVGSPTPAPAKRVATSKTPTDEAAIHLGQTYLGATLDGPLGDGFDPAHWAAELRRATKGVGTQLGTVVHSLADKTFPQIRAIDRAYQKAHKKSLLQLLRSEKFITGMTAFALEGLVMGPLRWDVYLLDRAVSAPKNDTLLIELLVGRPPSALALLRTAYARKDPSATPSKHKSLDLVVLNAFSASSAIRKAFEIALDSKWQDFGPEGQEDTAKRLPDAERQAMLFQDVDQLRVALTKNAGSPEMVMKILLNRSPTYIHSLTIEFLKKAHQSLTKAIKETYSKGTLQKLLLFAVENGKNDTEGPGVWRDAKLLWASMDGPGTRDDRLVWRLIRAHWDRDRFQAISRCFKAKQRKWLKDAVHDETSGSLRDLLQTCIVSSYEPYPSTTVDDADRLGTYPGGFSRANSRTTSMSSVSGLSDTSAGTDKSQESDKAELEGTGELMETSPSGSPVVDRTQSPSMLSGSQSHPANLSRVSGSSDSSPTLGPSGTPTLPSSASTPTLGSFRPPAAGHKSSSSLSFRQRTSPLDTTTHQPPSSAAGSGGGSERGLRHVRPVAPARAARRQSGEVPRSKSEEPEDLQDDGRRSEATSPTLSGRPVPLGLSRTTSTPLDLSTSPPSGLDTTQYHPAPISPVDENPPRPLQFPVSQGFFAPGLSPDKEYASSYMRRQHSNASNTSSDSSRPNSFFEGLGSGHGVRADSMFVTGHGLPISPAHHGRLTSTASLSIDDQAQVSQAIERQWMDKLHRAAQDHDKEMNDLERALEEAKSEVARLTRAEAQRSTTDNQRLMQISTLENKVVELDTSVKASRDSYNRMKTKWEQQCNETERVRDLVRQKDEELRAATALEGKQTAQLKQQEMDRLALQEAAESLKVELAAAQSAQEALVLQNEENMVLKETIDRLRFEMDELRLGRKDGSSGSSMVARSDGGSVPASLSRSLGRELLNRLESEKAAAAAAEAEEASSDDGSTDRENDIDELIVTTHRRIKKGKTREAKTAPEPVITHREEVTEVRDAETQTAATATAEIEIQTDLTAVMDGLVLASSIPPQLSDDAMREQVALQLGLSWVDLRTLVSDSKKPTRPPTVEIVPPSPFKRSSKRSNSRWIATLSRTAQAPAAIIAAFPESVQPFVASALGSATSFVLLNVVVFLTGVVTGISWRPTPAPFALLLGDSKTFHQLNTFGMATDVARSGFLHDMLWGSVAAARRFPV